MIPTINLYANREDAFDYGDVEVAKAQRASYGISDDDLADFGLFLDTIIQNALSRISQSRFISVPDGLTENEWRKILEEMEDTCEEIYERQYLLYTKSIVDFDSIREYKDFTDKVKAEMFAFRTSLYTKLAKYIEDMNILL